MGGPGEEPESSLWVPQMKWSGKPSQRALCTFQLRRVTTLERAFAAKGGALEAGEGGSIDVMLIRHATVHGLACHLLVPLALGAGHCDAGSRLEGRGVQSEWWQTASQVWGNTLHPDAASQGRVWAPGDQRLVFNFSSLLMTSTTV